MTRSIRRALGVFAWCALGGVVACDTAPVESLDTSGPVVVEVVEARLDTIRTSVSVTGTVTPAPGADWTVTAPAPGRIAQLPKNEGDAVRSGEIVVIFEVPSLTADLTARESEVAQATARLRTAQRAETRLTGLVDRGIAAQRELDDAHRDQLDADAGLAQAVSARTAAEALAGRLVVRARFSGVIARRWHNEGDLVDGGIGDPVLRLIDPSRLEIVAAVPVSDLGRVHRGRTASITDPGGGTRAGTVLTTPIAVETMAATGDVRVTLPSGSGLTVGTAVQLEIASTDRALVLVVPTAAVVRDGADTYVLVAGADNKVRHTPVTLGLSSRTLTHIVSGLTAGDRVVLPGPDPLPDGAVITIGK